MLRFLARGALGSLGLKIATVGLAFLNQLLVTRLMGAEQYSIYVYALTWLTVLGLMGRLGSDGMLTRFAAAYTAQRHWGLLKGLIRFGYGAVFTASMAVAGVTFLALAWFRADLAADAYPTYLAALCLLPVYGLTGVGQSLLYGFKRPWQAQSCDILARLFMMALAGAAYWHWRELSAFVGMLCGLAAATLVLLIASRWTRRAIPAETRANTRGIQAKHWLATALPMGFVALLRLLMDQGSLLLVGMLATDPKAVGIYAVALRLSELAAFGLQAVGMNLAPMISELHATQQKARLQELLTYTAYGIFGFTLAVGLVLYALGEPILKLFGAEFTAAYEPMVILMAGQVINALTGTVGSLMMMTGHQTIVARLVAFNTALSLGLNIWLVPRFGLNGAAFASATGIISVNLLSLIFVLRSLRLNPTVFRWPHRGSGL
ncbi:flippase, partial [Methylomagnum sp.]